MTFDLTSTPLATLDSGVLTLPISLEGAGNSLDVGALEQSVAALTALRDGDLDAGAVLLVGLGRNFCAGGNVAGFAAAEDRSAHVRDLAELLHGLVRLLDELDVPVVAAVKGWAAGAGLSLALGSDVVVGGPGTRMLGAYPGIGLSPDGGMSWLLPRLVGPAVARSFLLCNEPYDGARAYSVGMLTHLVEDDDRITETALAVARRLAAGPRGSHAAIKALVRDADTSTLSEHLDAERDSIARLAGTADGIEGVDAFVAKRAPSFGRSGR